MFPLNDVKRSSPTKPIGNLILSSCPGKKVRLTGPIIKGGRGAICRDLRSDLVRAIQAAEVRAIICCLDDEELDFLGSPWHEYDRVARELGLTIYRLPLVEGFAPSTPQELDSLLDLVMTCHTLRGQTVLVHCRGGVGRAGIVACGWLLKLGLIPLKGLNDDLSVFEVVTKVVDVIRHRRSIKAIETPYQVKFVLDFVNFLSKQAVPIRAQDLLDLLNRAP